MRQGSKKKKNKFIRQHFVVVPRRVNCPLARAGSRRFQLAWTKTGAILNFRGALCYPFGAEDETQAVSRVWGLGRMPAE